MIDLAFGVARAGFAVDAALAISGPGITAVIGRSGAGKSTLLLALAGLLRPRTGHIRVAGRTLFDASRGIDVPAHRRGLGVVFQEGRLFPHLSVDNNLRYGRDLSKRPAGPVPEDVIHLLGLETLLDRRPHTLSGGERQRVAIGRALLARPVALLMDEPLASLDPARRHELLGYIAQLPQRFGLTVLYVTHQIDEVLRLADQTVVLAEGKVIAHGSTLALLSDPALHPHVGRFEAGSVLEGKVEAHLDEWQLTEVRSAGQRITVPRLDAPTGAAVRMRVRARDVALQSEVLASSASNQLTGSVVRVLDRDGPYCAVEIALRAEAPPGERLWALVTRRSARTLGLVPGQRVVASFKAVAVEGRSVAFRPAASAWPSAR